VPTSVAVVEADISVVAAAFIALPHFTAAVLEDSATRSVRADLRTTGLCAPAKSDRKIDNSCTPSYATTQFCF